MKPFGTAQHREKKRYPEIFLIVFVVFILYQTVTSYLLTPFILRQGADAMVPTFAVGNRIISTPIYKVASLKRGSLVFVQQGEADSHFFLTKTFNAIVSFLTLNFYSPLESTSKFSSKPLLRRIVALPGDVIYMKDYILYVKKEGDEHFLTEFEQAEVDYNINTEGLIPSWHKELPFSGTMEEVKLKEGEYFVLCDNRVLGFDSRLMGTIDAKKNIKQKVLVRFWPLNKIKIF